MPWIRAVAVKDEIHRFLVDAIGSLFIGFLSVLLSGILHILLRKRRAAGDNISLGATQGSVNIKGVKMEKPFDLKDLAARCKAQGMPMAEDMLQKITKEVFAWASDSCAMKGGMFAVAVPLLPLVSEQILKLEDKIDGQEGV